MSHDELEDLLGERIERRLKVEKITDAASGARFTFTRSFDVYQNHTGKVQTVEGTPVEMLACGHGRVPGQPVAVCSACSKKAKAPVLVCKRCAKTCARCGLTLCRQHVLPAPNGKRFYCAKCWKKAKREGLFGTCTMLAAAPDS